MWHGVSERHEVKYINKVFFFTAYSLENRCTVCEENRAWVLQNTMNPLSKSNNCCRMDYMMVQVQRVTCSHSRGKRTNYKDFTPMYLSCAASCPWPGCHSNYSHETINCNQTSSLNYQDTVFSHQQIPDINTCFLTSHLISHLSIPAVTSG